MLWHKHLESLGKSNIFIHVFILVCRTSRRHGGRTHKRPSHNNPDEATNYVKAVDNLLKKFVSDIRGFNPYAHQDAYKNFLHTLSQLLSKLDSAYFTNMDTQLVLDTIPDKEYAAFLERPEETANKVQQCVSSDSIPTGSEVTTKICLDENITPFDKAGQQAITHLFSHLQDAHNHITNSTSSGTIE